MTKSFCMNCKKEVEESVEICNCGGKVFVFGDVKYDGKKDFLCSCGNEKFQSKSHIDFIEKSVTNYQCSECRNLIGIEAFRDQSSEMYFY